MANEKNLLVVDKISKSFVQRGLVLDNLSVNITEGDAIAIMGPSGSGKTTLMNIIGLLEKPDSGEIIFKGSAIADYTDDESAKYRNKNIGFVFQDHLLLPHLSVYENILLPLSAYELPKEEVEEKKDYIKLLMAKTGIDNLGKKYPSKISGGEAQRVALVRALINRPSLLLADEPTGSLDEQNAALLGDLLLEMNNEFNVTLLVATHSSQLAVRMAKTMRLSEGKLTVQ